MLWLEGRTFILSVNTSLIFLRLCFNWRKSFNTSENNTSVSSVMRRMIPTGSYHSDSVINYTLLYVTEIFKYTVSLVSLAVYTFYWCCFVFSQSWRKMSKNGHTFSFFFFFPQDKSAVSVSVCVCYINLLNKSGRPVSRNSSKQGCFVKKDYSLFPYWFYINTFLCNVNKQVVKN